MTLATAIETARKLATAKGMAVYVVRTGDGFVARTFADDCVAAVAVVVTPAGCVHGF